MTVYRSRDVLVVGLGRTGAACVRWLVQQGARVAVTDSRDVPPGQFEIRGLPVTARLGAFAAPLPLSQYVLAVVSPGVSLDEPFVRDLRAAGVPTLGDIELFARSVDAPVIGITGSNGKSTVTTLLGEMAKRADVAVAVGGNLGTPALDLLSPDVQLYVMELSSFQLESLNSLRCDAATVLNVSADHLDRHGGMEAYAETKARIFNGCRTALVNRHDPQTARNARSALTQRSFGLDAPAEGEYGLLRKDGEDWLACGGECLLKVSQLKLFGRHNVANALAALALADAAGLPRAASLAVLGEFRGLRHRCEWVAEVDGVTWFNDSKGTNVGATLAAVSGLSGPVVWLAGGQSKGQDFSPLRGPLVEKGRAAILFGEDAARIDKDLQGALPIFRELDLDASVRRARTVVQSGDQVLLSPACASLDQFQNYEARGDAFCNLVRAFAAGAPTEASA